MRTKERWDMPIPTDIQLEKAREHWSACALVARHLTTSGLIINEIKGRPQFVGFDREGNVVNDRYI